MNTSIPRPEHPFPQFERADWLNLNGQWDFEIDQGLSGEERRLYEDGEFSEQITVPFCPESELSGVNNKDFMRCVWYRRAFTLPESFEGKRVFLHIGACDYFTKVWINGSFAFDHIGGYVSFSGEITKFLLPGENTVVVRAEDNLRSGNQPAGKQCVDYYSSGCSYTRTTGIWQTVWLEATPQARIVSAKYQTYTDGLVKIDAEVEGADGLTLCAEASFNGEFADDAEIAVEGENVSFTLCIDEPNLWDVGQGNLYDLKLTLGDDTVNSYFGIRQVSFGDHRFYINGRSVFGRFILDQGFYPDGIYTAPSDAELEADITRSVACGFNGARLHQKIFEPRFLYHADRLGYMVWGEHANWGLDISRPAAWRSFGSEWLAALKRDFDHPSIIGWCPFNETQRNQDSQLIRFIYEMTKAYDTTRPVIDCSGWLHVDGCCDMYDCHDYEQNPEKFKENFDRLMDGKRAKSIFDWLGELPEELCFVSEFGGTRWPPEQKGGWGYGQSVKDGEEFLARYKGLVSALLQNERLCAFCYTQLTDVEQEQNGLYTYDRKPKFPPEVLNEITSAKAAVED